MEYSSAMLQLSTPIAMALQRKRAGEEEQHRERNSSIVADRASCRIDEEELDATIMFGDLSSPSISRLSHRLLRVIDINRIHTYKKGRLLYLEKLSTIIDDRNA